MAKCLTTFGIRDTVTSSFTLGSKKVGCTISGPDQAGERREVPRGPESEHPHGLIFLDSC